MIDPVRIVFMGTPEFAVPTLRRLAATPGLEVTGVVSQPDRPVGRKAAVLPPPVKDAARELMLPVLQPEKMREPAVSAWLRAQSSEVLAVVAFGQILPRAVFEMPRYGAINAHASLLPKYRGAAPIQWAVANGETRTGVTTMQINAGLDTGDMLLRREVEIGPAETAAELSRRLADVAAELMVETLLGLGNGCVTACPQPEEATVARILKREDGRADWTLPAYILYNRWRGFQPWPGLWMEMAGKRVAILACQAGSAEGFPVACGDGAILTLTRVQVEGRRPVSGLEFRRGMGALLDPIGRVQ